MGGVTGRLVDKVALVTGAGQGIGAGIAAALAKEGAAVALAGRTVAKVEAKAAALSALGLRVIALQADVSVRVDVDRMVAETVAAFGRLDALVNNAQDSTRKRLVDITDEDVDLAWRTGPLASLHCMQAALPHLRETRGCIVNLGSSTAITGDATFGSYAMAKEAIRALTRVAATEWGPDGIRVNTICPAAFSESAKEWSEEHPDAFAKVLKNIPLRRMGDPEVDIGRAVVALVSDDLGYLTASTLVLEGGRITLG
ncbi:MAG: short-chain dehydrogenase [Ilumatobacteraceae bacterium]|nr:short-chain dehydrogenase [Ilumatobacteraceae bacterium]